MIFSNPDCILTGRKWLKYCGEGRGTIILLGINCRLEKMEGKSDIMLISRLV
jgi:hypothetical protein